MRVYHFVNAVHGLDDIKQRRLKIATLHDLNDPFELLALNLSDAAVRRAFAAMKGELSRTRGLLCFSRRWNNPVQWSHYADRHKGLCLAFDIRDELLGEVNYSRRRLAIEAERLLRPRDIDEDTARKLFFTKFSHWRYEAEIRSFVTLEERDQKTGLYFADFSHDVKLVQVIVGAVSQLTRQDITGALRELAPQVECFKVRLAFKSFGVVRQRNASLWT
jgi:hypothetical protein